MNADSLVAFILIPMGIILMLCGLLVYDGRFRHYRAGLNIVMTGELALATGPGQLLDAALPAVAVDTR